MRPRDDARFTRTLFRIAWLAGAALIFYVALPGLGADHGQVPTANDQPEFVGVEPGPRTGARSLGHERLPVVGTIRTAMRLKDIAREHAWANVFGNVRRVAILKRWIEDAGRTRPGLAFLVACESLLAGDTSGAIESLRELHGGLSTKERSDDRSGIDREVASQLAMAHLRQGEEDNCIARHGVDSCLMPIAGGGVHVDQTGSRAAVEGLTKLLEEDPEDLRSRWLLNLAYMTLGEYPQGVPEAWRLSPEAFESEYDIGRFYDVAGPAGLATEGHAGGCVVDDFDGDLDLDVMVSSFGLAPIDQLHYLENKGDGTFADRTNQAGLKGLVGGLNLTPGDFDNDGDLDVLVLRGAWLTGKVALQPNSLLRNDGTGRFADVAEEVGLGSLHPTQVAAVSDYDGDGWLDIFVGNESLPDDSHASELFHNDGDGTFTEVSTQVGLHVDTFVKGAAWGDYDNDGRPDLYVSMLQERPSNLLFRNLGRTDSGATRFEEVGGTAGVRGPPTSFATWFFDYDNDGWLDLYATRFDGEMTSVAADYFEEPGHLPEEVFKETCRPALHRNNRDGTFTDVALEVGLDHALLTMGCNYGDLDNDGWLDFYVGTGRPDLRTLVPNRMFRNDGGRRFQDVTTSGGFGHLQKGHGIAFADVDNDGDQDVFAVMGGAYSTDSFRNSLFLNPGHGNAWLGFDLVGTRSNRDAIGARVCVRTQGPSGRREIHGSVGSGGSFGAHSLTLRLGLGDADRIEEVEIRWPAGGRVDHLRGLDLDRIYRVVEGNPTAEPLEVPRIPLAGSPEEPSCCLTDDFGPLH